MPSHTLALFGLGRAGMIHFQNVISNHRMRLSYIVEADTSLAVRVLEEFNQTGMTTVLSPQEADKVYTDPELEGVIVATPTYTHNEIVIKALHHGKGVFCEKPIAEDPDGTRLCYEAAEKAGKPLLCSFNRRFDPSLRIVHQRVKNQEAGKVHMVRSTARDSPLPPIEYIKISGGIFHDCAVHDIDLICWVLGEYPTKVYTQATSHVKAIGDLDDVDCAAIVLNFASGAIAVIDIDRDAKYGYDQRLEVFGDLGMVLSENQLQSGVVTSDGKGIHQDKMYFSFPQRYADSYINALLHFLDVLEGKMPCEVTKENTLLVSKIADACTLSHKSGLPVDID